MSLYITSTSLPHFPPLFLSYLCLTFPHSFLLLVLLFSSLFLSFETNFLNFLSLSLYLFIYFFYCFCTCVLLTPFLYALHIFVLCFFLALPFPLFSAVLLYLCLLAVLSVGCSYLNLTLILHMELLSKHQRKEGIGEQTEISGRSAKKQSHKVYTKSRVNLLSKMTWVCKQQQILYDYPWLYLLAKIFTVH